jgi:hypothetical protein
VQIPAELQPPEDEAVPHPWKSVYLNRSTGVLHSRIMAVVVLPMIRLRIREWP